MLTMTLKRLVVAVPSLIGVVIVTFLLTRALPGDPAAYFAGPAATKEAIEQIRVKLGLDKPLIVQFGHYVSDLARGDLGNSLTTGQPVATEIATRLPASAELTLLGLLLSVVHRRAARHPRRHTPGSLVDHACRVVATAGVSLPVFFTGLILVYVFYYLLGWAPAPLGRLDIFFSPPPHVTGFYLIDSAIAGDWEVFRASVKQLVLPALTLGIFSLAPIARMTRASMLAVLASDFVRTARASGLTPFTVIVTYAFRNAMLPVVTTLGMVFSFLLGANVLVEKVFAWPGIGSYAVEALIASDFAPVQGFVLTMAVDVRRPQPADRHPLRPDRPAREDRGMSDIAAGNTGTSRGQRPCRDPAARALRDRREPGHRLRLRPVRPDRARGPVRPARRPLRSARQQHGAGAEGALGRALVRHRPARPRHALSRVIVATRLDFIIAVSSVVLVFLMGGLAGVAAGFFGGWTDRIVSRIADTIMAFPLFVLAMGIVAALGNTVTNIVIATAIVNFPLYARVARAEANVRREAGFVQAARLSGNGEYRILLGHVLPNIMPIMIVQMSLTMGYAILNAAGLSFIGLGVRPPTPGVGHHGCGRARPSWSRASGGSPSSPALALMVAVFCFNLLGDGLRDIVDPQRRT